jgi:hypothetical protein
MKFEFKINKLANQFFFISNLSEWHFSCRKDYNKEWLKQTGLLNKDEVRALKRFKKIIKKYGFFINNKTKETKYLGKIFYLYSENDAWKKLETSVNKKEYLIIKNTFDAFQERFEKIWVPKELSQRIQNLDTALKSQQYRGIFDELVHLFNNKHSVKKITIIALTSPLSGEGVTAGGGANIGDNHITLEIPKLKINSWEFEYSIGILAHEIGHIFLRKSNHTTTILNAIKDFKLPKQLSLNIQPRYSSLEFITELLIGSLIPYGYLAQKYFKFKPLDIVFSKSNLEVLGENLQNFTKGKKASGLRLRKLLVWQLYPLVAFYVESQKKIDKNFIFEIGKSVINLTSKTKRPVV